MRIDKQQWESLKNNYSVIKSIKIIEQLKTKTKDSGFSIDFYGNGTIHFPDYVKVRFKHPIISALKAIVDTYELKEYTTSNLFDSNKAGTLLQMYCIKYCFEREKQSIIDTINSIAQQELELCDEVFIKNDNYTVTKSLLKKYNLLEVPINKNQYSDTMGLKYRSELDYIYCSNTYRYGSNWLTWIFAKEELTRMQEYFRSLPNKIVVTRND